MLEERGQGVKDRGLGDIVGVASQRGYQGVGCRTSEADRQGGHQGTSVSGLELAPAETVSVVAVNGAARAAVSWRESVRLRMH